METKKEELRPLYVIKTETGPETPTSAKQEDFVTVDPVAGIVSDILDKDQVVRHASEEQTMAGEAAKVLEISEEQPTTESSEATPEQVEEAIKASLLEMTHCPLCETKMIKVADMMICPKCADLKPNTFIKNNRDRHAFLVSVLLCLNKSVVDRSVDLTKLSTTTILRGGVPANVLTKDIATTLKEIESNTSSLSASNRKLFLFAIQLCRLYKGIVKSREMAATKIEGFEPEGVKHVEDTVAAEATPAS